MTDSLSRFLFEKRAVRGEIVQLEKSYQQILASYQYPAPIARLLGELMAAASLLTATLKFKGEIALQIQSEGLVKYAVINGTHEQKLRGVARWDESVSDLPNDFQSLFKKGVLAITLAPFDGERYQGVVALDQESLAACLENYFLQSEQLLTKVYLSTRINSQTSETNALGTDNSRASGNASGTDNNLASGMLLQIVPQTSETYQASENKDFEDLSVLANTITDEELLGLPAQEIIRRLFHEEDVRLYQPQEVVFECDCSKARSAQALRNVPKSELLQIVQEDGEIKMNCQFCHTEYRFDAVDVENIHADNFSAFTEAGTIKH
uniref:Hsp33 family molecular chaperone HslO n=1 Tax=Ningiella ruwaisensis TaxID=2364274 RepID=UPI00109F74E0|nr:Hsp33 family molecular chaperone HslO [Ningiella ruwaisensis]